LHVTLIAHIFPDILFNYPPILIILPVAITLSLANVSSVTTLAIAIDRVHSIYWPIDYQHKNKERYATLTGMIGCICAIIELIALCASTPFVEHRGCPTFGCFVNATYIAYVKMLCFDFGYDSAKHNSLALKQKYK
jgi:hypothetical protein